ncbi:hypothetical protein BC826DRAFT_1012433 [Russula brevipes]|nr:hypothetical protein BC826DRAFT_1012433 [Russula brevipes]
MATTAGTSTPSSPLPSTASTIWAHLLNHRGPSKANATTQLASGSGSQLTPHDKAGTSTRILLHDTHARLEKFSERANAIFSGIETSRREMVRVREQVESARESELDTIAQLINRCQSSIQKTIGEPAQAREVTTMHASLAVLTERLHTLEDKMNNKLDALTALVQTQTQLSQSLQEQFSRTQIQQSRILELLAPLHPILQSVPLHINLARNAILEKVPKRCRCRCDDRCSSPSITSAMSPRRTPSSKKNAENAEPPLEARKRRRIDIDALKGGPLIWRHQAQPVVVVQRPTPNEFARKPEEAPTWAQPRRIDTVSAVQTPRGGKSVQDAGTRSHLSTAALATRLSTVPRDNQNFHTSSRVRAGAVPGKRFILVDDDDDDEEEL